jgi:ribosome maturation factor RimP
MGVIQVVATDIMELVQSIVPDEIGIYEARVLPASGGFHFEVVLDGLADPRGAVSLAQCERFSRDLAALLDQVILELDSIWAGKLPEGLSEENYTIEVSSAGAERRLRLPEDLERFQGQPIRLKLPGKTKDGKDTISVRLVVFDRKENEDWCFQDYLATSKRASRVRKRREKREAKKSRKNDLSEEATAKGGDELRLGPRELADPKLKANLYLDY